MDKIDTGATTREGIPTQMLFDESQAPNNNLSKIPPADLNLAKAVTQVLMKQYPGHPWAVWASHEQGVVVIKLPNLTDSTGLLALGRLFGMVLHIDKMSEGTFLQDVTRAGGELLERWGIRRGAYRNGTYAESAPAFNDAHVPVVLDQFGRPSKRRR